MVGKNATDAALVQQYVGFANNELFPAVATWVFPIYGALPFNKNAVASAKTDAAAALGALNTLLATRTFLVGERISLADITVATVLVPLFEHALDAENRGKYGNVTRWLNTLVHQKEFQAVYGTVQFTDVEKQPGAAADAVATSGAAASGSGSSSKKKEEKKEEKKKETAAAPAADKKKKKDDDEEEEEPVEKEEKPEKVFELLPKSTFDLDEFKRTYSNEDTATKAIPYFWDHFDKEGYSIWRGDYKYPEELSKIFMTANLVSGFFQRIEKLRKFAFGAVLIFGTDGNNSISGIWVTRGQELVFSLNEDWNVDAPSYDWKKLNPDNENDKKMINEFFLWEGEECKRRNFNQGKTFK